MSRLLINNNDYTSYIDGLDDLILSIEKDDSGLADVSFSQALKVNGKFHDLLEKTFYKNVCDSLDKKLIGKIYLNCGYDFEFELTPESVSYCADGCSEINIKVKTARTDKLDCLKKQLNFWKKNGLEEYLIKNNRLYKIMYCHDGGMMQRIIIEILSILSIIFDIFQAICKIIEIFGDVGFCKRLDQLEGWALGCDKYHNAILLRDIFEYNSKLCGLEFDSNLLQKDFTYKNTALESAIANEGFTLNKCTDRFNTDNQENRNILQIANKLIPVFNGYVNITGSKFIFDHVSRRDQELKNILNIEKERSTGNIEDCPIYSVNGEKLCAYLKIEYTQDGTDWQGNKMINDYNETIEWNENNKHPNNKGECRVNIDFSPSRFTHDRVLKESSWYLSLAHYRNRGGIGLITSGCNYQHAQVLSEGQFEKSKLIIIDQREDKVCGGCTFKTVIKKQIDSIQGTSFIEDVYDYNRPLKGSELYDKFHKYDDPNGTDVRIIKTDEIEWKPKDFCSAVKQIIESGLNIGIDSIYGVGIPSSIDIDTSKCIIKFKDVNFKCLRK